MPRPGAPQIHELKVLEGGVLATIFFPGAQTRVGEATLASLLGRPKPGPATGTTRRGPSKVSAILAAMEAGADTPLKISEKTQMENSRVHAFLAYLRRSGKVRKVGKRYVPTKRAPP
ncbi:MAG: hypothetical protein ACYDCK_11665 [Thermoplasmatota archaeon]